MSFGASLSGSVGAVILAGGFGTRMPKALRSAPKAMIPVRGNPFVLYIVTSLLRDGLRPIVILGGHKGEVIREYFERFPWSTQVRTLVFDPVHGTGGDLLKAVGQIPGLPPQLLVLNADTAVDLPLLELLTQHADTRSHCTIVLTRLGGVPNEGAYYVRYDNVVVSSREAIDDDVSGSEAMNHASWRGSSTGVVLFDRDVLAAMAAAYLAEPPRSLSLERELLPRLISDGALRAFDNEYRFFLHFGSSDGIRRLRAMASDVVGIYVQPEQRAMQ